MNLRSFHFYNAHIRQFLGTDLHLFELSVWMQSLAHALISVFIPIILYKLGVSIAGVVFFYFLFNAIDVPLNMVAKRFIEKYGARAAIILAIFAHLVHYLLLYNLNGHSIIQLILLAFTLAFYDTFYWVGHLYIFTKSARGSIKIKKDISALNIIRIFAGILAPVAGAYILIMTDQKTLVFFATLLMFASLIPIYKMSRLVFKPEQKSKPFKEFFKNPYQKIDYIFEFFAALKEEMELGIWPFFIFLVYDDLKTVAYMPVLISLSAIVATYITSKKIIRENIYRLISIGALFIGLFWVMRTGAYTMPLLLYASVFLVALCAILIDLPLEVSLLERGKRTDPLSAATYLNLSRMAGRCALYLVLLIAIRYADIFTVSFVLSIVLILSLSAVSYLISRKQNANRLAIRQLPEA